MKIQTVEWNSEKIQGMEVEFNKEIESLKKPNLRQNWKWKTQTKNLEVSPTNRLEDLVEQIIGLKENG